eukprot:CAMPEP_0198694596 /NCGR_PEP_ID=MMETSP1468-20131203/272528_1 /TAXON_ID=1461545 /ORGANISM="Mantoniella sp, Strain CCMP1436" /LENGTH=220 /DNA_ID=CAMNT_0044449853 /DNA_START=453 /DNA_END=1113 /DNA_ORIENTATION=+
MSGVHLEAVEVDLLATMHRHEDAEQSAGDEEREGPVHPRVKRRVYTVQVQLRVPPPLPEELAQARLVAHVLHHRLAVVVPEAVVAAVGDAVRRLGAHVLLEPLGGGAVESKHHIVPIDHFSVLVLEQDPAAPHNGAPPVHDVLQWVILNQVPLLDFGHLADPTGKSLFSEPGFFLTIIDVGAFLPLNTMGPSNAARNDSIGLGLVKLFTAPHVPPPHIVA